MVEQMVTQMVQLLESDWVLLMESHLGLMTEMNSVHLKGKLKASRWGCLMADLLETQMVLMSELGFL